MKKTQSKALSQLAQLLPPSKELIVKGSLVSGQEVLKSGKHKDLDFEVMPEDWLKQRKNELIDIDHHSRLKKAWRRNKEQGLSDYIEWVDANNKRLNKLIEDLELKEVEQKVLNLAKQKGISFWAALIAFIYSFFITKKPANV